MITPQQLRNPQVKPKWQLPVGVMESVVAYNCRKCGLPRPIMALPMWEGAGNRVFDYSGNGNRGSLVGKPDWRVNGLEFDGTNDYIDLDFWNTTGKETILTTVLFDEAIGNIEQIISADDSGATPARNLQFRRNASGKLELVMWTETVVKVLTGSTTLSSGVEWNVETMIDGTNIHIYVNGIEDATEISAGDIDNNTGVHLIIGARDKDGNLSTILEKLQGNVKQFLRFPDSIPTNRIKLLSDNPYALYQIPEELYGYVAAIGAVSPTSVFYGPLVGPLGGPI